MKKVILILLFTLLISGCSFLETDRILLVKNEISLLNHELAKYKYLNHQIKSTEDQLCKFTVSMNEYSDELLKLYIRNIKVTNKGDLKITFKSGLEMQIACRCTLASA